MKNKGALSEDELVSLVKSRISSSVSGSNSALARARLRAQRFYSGEEPRPLHRGNASFISRDVYDAVEGRKASLLETFTGNAKPVRFSPQGPNDVELAKQATDYTDYVIFRENNGYQVMHDIIHDGLIARCGIAQIWWEQDSNVTEEKLPGVSQAEANAFVLQHRDKIKTFDMSPNDDGTFDVTLSIVEDLSQVKVEAVPPEEFGLSNRAINLDDCDIVFRKQFKSVAELKKQGYPASKLDELAGWGGDDLISDPEVAERFYDVDSGLPEDSPQDPGMMKIEVYDCYARMDLDGSGQIDVVHIVYAADTILFQETVARHPFVAYVPLRIPHRFYGDDFASSVIPVQIANTFLTRSIIDHAMVTTNPRYQVVRGALSNPKELIEQRLGGIINVTRPDAIIPMPQPSLSPMVFQTIEKMDALKEAITGTSDLSQGLSKDALSYQNSADLVAQMATMGQTRAKIMARNFADFLRDVFIRVYLLVAENENRQKVIDVSGSWVQVDPQDWEERKDVSVSFALGYGEQDKEAQKLFQFDQYMASQQGMAPVYTVAERYNVWSEILALQGRPDIERYLKNPATVKPPGPSQQQLFEAQMQNRDMGVKEQIATAKLMTANAKVQNDAVNTASKSQTNRVNDALKQQDQALKTAQFQHQAVMDAAEVALQHRAHDIKAVAKPVAVQPR